MAQFFWHRLIISFVFTDFSSTMKSSVGVLALTLSVGQAHETASPVAKVLDLLSGLQVSEHFFFPALNKGNPTHTKAFS